MNRIHRWTLFSAIIGALLIGYPFAAWAAVPAEIGPYRVRIVTDPGVIPVGKARLRIDVKDASGKPVDGLLIRSLVKMPAMSMGEKETAAAPIPGRPGAYTTEATFTMAGAYEASIAINGPLGDASGTVSLETGQNTEQEASASFSDFLYPVAGGVIVVAFVAFVLYRMRITGQRIAWRSAINRTTVSGALLLVAAYAASRYAIDHWRRPGAMTPFEAQSMQMSTPAPPGATPVALAAVTRGAIDETVWYPGQAVAFNEQEVSARTEGWLNWMPFYKGQRVKAGEVVARLDINLLHAHLGEREAAVDMASAGVNVSERERLQAFADIERVRGELRGKSDALAGAEAEVSAAREERAVADAALAAKQSAIAEAEAMVTAMEADRQFWQQVNTRNKTLVDKGALSNEEYQRDAAMAANSVSKVEQARSRLAQAQADVRGAQAMTRKADAMIAAAEKKRQQMASDVLTGEAAVKSAEALAAVSAAKVDEARAGVAQARGSLATQVVTHGFAEIQAQIDGVVTDRRIGPGQLVTPGQAILKVAQIDPIRLQANVAEIDLGRIRVGDRFLVRDTSGAREPVAATVTSIAPTLDLATRTGIVEAVAPNKDGHFVPGQSIGVDISTGHSADALRVPLAAVHTRAQAGRGVLAEGSARYVWVAEESGTPGQYRVKPVDVETGVSDGLHVQILAGLEAGQKVVLTGNDYLKRGDMVFAAGESEVAR